MLNDKLALEMGALDSQIESLMGLLKGIERSGVTRSIATEALSLGIESDETSEEGEKGTARKILDKVIEFLKKVYEKIAAGVKWLLQEIFPPKPANPELIRRLKKLGWFHTNSSLASAIDEGATAPYIEEYKRSLSAKEAYFTSWSSDVLISSMIRSGLLFIDSVLPEIAKSVELLKSGKASVLNPNIVRTIAMNKMESDRIKTAIEHYRPKSTDLTERPTMAALTEWDNKYKPERDALGEFVLNKSKTIREELTGISDDLKSIAAGLDKIKSREDADAIRNVGLSIQTSLRQFAQFCLDCESYLIAILQVRIKTCRMFVKAYTDLGKQTDDVRRHTKFRVNADQIQPVIDNLNNVITETAGILAALKAV